ncbi:MAG: hypothetical protein JXQ75_02260 [Phycisphaerae bacterium]|nr:hypothetical protein [Phycisphaerae bacterium]
MKSRLVIGALTLLGCGLVAGVFLPSFMAPINKRAARSQLGRQELRELHSQLVAYRQDHHGRLPASLDDVLRETEYLRDVEPRSRADILDRMSYAPAVATSGPVIWAAFKCTDSETLYLMEDGTITNVPAR